jgi:hypothetical protein
MKVFYIYISLQMIVFYSMYKHQHFSFFSFFFLTTSSESLLGNQHKSETREKLNMTSTRSNESRSCISFTCRDMSLTFCLQTTYMHIYIGSECSCVSVTDIIHRSITKPDTFSHWWLKSLCLMSNGLYLS